MVVWIWQLKLVVLQARMVASKEILSKIIQRSKGSIF